MKKLNNTYITNLFNKVLSESLEERADDIVKELESMGDIDKMMRDPVESSGETCEQCSGEMGEGETCEQCGHSNENLKEQDMDDEFETEIEAQNEDTCGYHMKEFGPEDERTIRFCSSVMEEGSKGKTRRMSKKNKKIQTDEEVEEGNAFTGALAKAKKRGKDSFEVDGKKYEVEEKYETTDKKSSNKKKVRMKESEMINFIEKIVKEQKKKGNITNGRSSGEDKYNNVHKKSGDENKRYIKDVTKKMKDYLKDGSKGEYDMNPKIFPEGNGQLEKMSKKAYVPSKDVEEYVDAFTAAGQENLDYDEIKPNEEWLDKNMEGSSVTGNNPDWGNAVETSANKRRNKVRKDNLLSKAKRKAYNKANQPVVQDKTGEDEGDKILNQLESTKNKEGKKLNEEFDKIKKIISYDRKTQ